MEREIVQKEVKLDRKEKAKDRETSLLIVWKK